MVYEITIKNQAEQFIKKLDKITQKQILTRIEKLRLNPYLGKSLVGRLSGLRSLRVGIYSVLYEVKEMELMVIVLKIGHRKSVY